MPLYNFECSSCKTVTELSKRIAERDETAEDTCPSCKSTGTMSRCVGAPLVAYSVTVAGGYGRVSDGWKEVLKKINTAPGANKNTSSFL